MAETFVLVHGAWHGAWCWAAVIRQLEMGGDRAFAVDLPGRGTNPAEHVSITRAMWVDSVARFIEERDLREVVLVGHSMGGLTISSVAEKIPRRLKRVVFLSAIVIPGEVNLIEDLTPVMRPEAAPHLIGLAQGEPSYTLSVERFRANFIQDGSRDLQDFVYAALVPEVSRTAIEPVSMKEFHRLDLPTGYVACEDDLVFDDPAAWHPRYSSRLRNPLIHTIKSGHEVMFTHPVECAGALTAMARG